MAPIAYIYSPLAFHSVQMNDTFSFHNTSYRNVGPKEATYIISLKNLYFYPLVLTLYKFNNNSNKIINNLYIHEVTNL